MPLADTSIRIFWKITGGCLNKALTTENVGNIIAE